MSGSIWAEEPSEITPDEDTSNPNPGCEYLGQLEEHLKSDAIAPARSAVLNKATNLKNRLMKLIGMVSQAADPAEKALHADVSDTLNDVYALSRDLTNETERDLYAVCDLLAISLSVGYAEKLAGAGLLKEEMISASADTPYLYDAFLTYKSEVE